MSQNSSNEQVMVPSPLPTTYHPSSGFDVRPEDVSTTTETYIRRLFHILGRDVEIYVLAGVTPHEVAGLLISKYRSL